MIIINEEIKFAGLIPSCHCHNFNLFFSYAFIFILILPEGRAGDAW